MAYLVLPPQLLRFTEGFRIANSAKSGGQTLSGQERFVVSPAARWEAKISLHCVEETDFTEADGFIASLDGPATPFLCGPIDWRGRPWNTFPLTGEKITPKMGAFDASIDPAFETNPLTASGLQFSLAQAAQMNATSLQIRRTRGGALRRGQYLEINNRLHMIVALETPDPTDQQSGLPIPGVIGVTIRPWLREAAPVDVPVEFANPRGLMRLTAQSAAMVERTTNPLSDLSLDLIEYF